MRWEGLRRSTNVEDRRGMRVGRVGAGVGAGGLLLAVVAALLGAPPSVVRDILGGGGAAPVQTEATRPPTAEEQRLADFSAAVLGSTEDVWAGLFGQGNRRYQPPELVLFTEGVESACGLAGSAVGPFYCPADQKVYLDLSFFDDLHRRFGAAGDFAQAYVIAHEVGHHVQTVLGISERVMAERRRVSPEAGNRLSVMQELQADCLAGVWARHAETMKQVLEPGDLEEALRAASAIGDDTLQKKARGQVVPESFTHGTSAQRMRWFQVGFDRGSVDSCDTFKAGQL